MSKFDSTDNLIHKIFKFITTTDKHKIKCIIKDTPLSNRKLLSQNINNISETIVRYTKYINLEKDPNRQEFIVDKICNFINSKTQIELNDQTVIVDIGGGNGNVLSGINSKLGGPKENFICVESTNWVEQYEFNNDNITYKFWNNNQIDIPDNTCDILLCMVSLHHMTTETIMNTFNEIKRILKPSGLLLIKEHDADPTSIKLIEWEHHLYHILDCAYNKERTNAIEYLEKCVHNFNSKSFWNSVLVSTYGFKMFIRGNRFLDGPYVENDSKNPTKLYWDVYVNQK